MLAKSMAGWRAFEISGSSSCLNPWTFDSGTSEDEGAAFQCFARLMNKANLRICLA